MRLLAVGVFCALLVPWLLAGCQSEQEAYCATLREEQDAFRALDRDVKAGEAGAIADGVAVFRELRAQAPDDMTDEWDTYLRGWQELQAALDRAGATESVFRRGEPPPGVSVEDYEAIQDAATGLLDPRVVRAASGIEQQARDVCKIELSRSQLR